MGCFPFQSVHTLSETETTLRFPSPVPHPAPNIYWSSVLTSSKFSATEWRGWKPWTSYGWSESTSAWKSLYSGLFDRACLQENKIRGETCVCHISWSVSLQVTISSYLPAFRPRAQCGGSKAWNCRKDPEILRQIAHFLKSEISVILHS